MKEETAPIQTLRGVCGRREGIRSVLSLGVQTRVHTAPVDLVERKGPPFARHPWEVARAEFFLRLLGRHGYTAGGDWLDAGAGDAWLGRRLRALLPPASTMTCWDVNYTKDDLEMYGASGVAGIAFVADRPTKRFDRVLMLDVIEHVEDEVAFVAAIVEDLLVEDGVLLVSVPAYPSLYCSHDRVLRHYRRYSPGDCRRLLERAGLAVISSGGLFFSLLPARTARVLVERLLHVRPHSSGVGDWQAGRVVTGALTRALVADGRLSLLLSERGFSLPGLSYWALCRPSL